MKKFLKVLSVALLVVVLAFAFAGCDKSGSIKKAFENEGYTVTTAKAEDSTVLKSILTEEQQKNIEDYEVIVCAKGLQSATIIKFPSSSDIKEALGDDGYAKAEDSGYVNGNCYLAVPLSTDATKIFKNA
jgi:hypothetical protein